MEGFDRRGLTFEVGKGFWESRPLPTVQELLHVFVDHPSFRRDLFKQLPRCCLRSSSQDTDFDICPKSVNFTKQSIFGGLLLERGAARPRVSHFVFLCGDFPTYCSLIPELLMPNASPISSRGIPICIHVGFHPSQESLATPILNP